jgi:biopolymer transport protein ExbD
MRNLLTSLALCGALLACSAEEPAPPAVVSALAVSIDADNNCALEARPVACKQVAAVIKTRYPTSKPRVDICLDKQARYEAAVEVMNSVSAAGFTVGSFECGATAGG